MTRFAPLIFLILLCTAANARAAENCAASADSSPARLTRGVNLTRWWENDQSQALAPADIKRLRAFGFDFVRLPLSPKWLRLDDDERNEKLGKLRCDLVALLDRGLSVIVDLHAPQRFQADLADNPDDAAERLEDLWKKLQPAIEGLPPDRILLGLYNEPQIDSENWWRIQGQLMQDLRPVFPKNPFVATAGPHGDLWNLVRMKPYDDKNVVYDFHYYEPIFFTHHGAVWFPADDPVRKSDPVGYPVQPGDAAAESDPDVKNYLAAGWNRVKLAGDIEKAAAWARQNDVRIACLEFGVYRPHTDAQSRANWLRDMRELLEQNGIPWALWEYRGGFGFLGEDWTADEGIAKALGLNDSPNP
jgi:hypothetical protein